MKTLKDLELQGKKVLLRCDFNVPLKDGVIQDDTRIREALPTIKELLSGGAAVILISHLGRPKGQRVDELSLKPVADRLTNLLKTEVFFCDRTVGEKASSMAASLKSGEILLLENLRFNPEEKANDEKFARQLANMADLFVQDAFGTVHREHASMVGVPALLPSAAGRLLEKEIDFLSRALQPEHPFVVILGGAKLETKIPVIKNMLGRADVILVGGGMAYTLLKAQGHEIGNSLLDVDSLSTASDILQEAKDKGVDLVIPVDHIGADALENPSKVEEIVSADIPEGLIGVDIGAETIGKFREKLSGARTIVLNGPMGVFENEKFANGTKEVFKAVAQATESGAVSILGGGDTVSAVKNLGLDSSSFSHISTGGGASLKFLEGKELPGIKMLDRD